VQYVRDAKLKDNTPITIRPIRPEDEPLMVEFHRSLSDESVQFRYFHALKLGERIAHDRLSRVCFIDYDREMALVATITEPSGSGGQQTRIIGVGRLSKLHGTDRGEFALIISDDWRNKGLGSLLLGQLLEIGRDERLSGLTAEILPYNIDMQRLCRKLGFCLKQQGASLGDAVRAELLLK
jgi:acetyltransferase